MPGGRQLAQCPPFLFGAKGASAGESIKQRLPFRCNETKTSPTAGRNSLWSPSQRHHQSHWQARTNFSQDQCTRCSPPKWPILGALPTQYLGRGPRPLPINRTSHPHGKGYQDRNQRECRVVGATYANGWLIIVGASKTSPVPGNGMRRRHARRQILPSFGALHGDNTPTAALRGLRMVTR